MPVSNSTSQLFTLSNNITGSGCVAALEAEKFLADQEEGNSLENENEAEKSQTNGVVPEYRSNPLL